MTRIKFVLGLLITYATYYPALMLWDHLRNKPADKSKDGRDQTEAIPKPHAGVNGIVALPASLLVHDTVIRSLFAYDNGDHKSMVHVRFDKQTVDLMNKFKLASGVDITKFVAFAVKYFFETNPELKTIIKQYLKNTEL
jgi:hypothetical protein